MSKSVILSIFDPRDYSEHSLSVESKDIEILRLSPVYDVVYFSEDQFKTKKVTSKFYISVKNVVEIFKSFDLSDSIYIREIKLIDRDKVETFSTEVDSSFVSEIKDDLLILRQL